MFVGKLGTKEKKHFCCFSCSAWNKNLDTFKFKDCLGAALTESCDSFL